MYGIALAAEVAEESERGRHRLVRRQLRRRPATKPASVRRRSWSMDSSVERQDGAAAEGVGNRPTRTKDRERAGARALGVHKTRIAPGRPPHVVIVGAGFAGLGAAKRLGRAPVEVTVIDRRNHHLFQPLLYQVATAALSPADIAAPIRA